MSGYLNGRKIAKPYFSGQKNNAYLNGHKIFASGPVPDAGQSVVSISPLTGRAGITFTLQLWLYDSAGNYLPDATAQLSVPEYFRLGSKTTGPATVSVKSNEYYLMALTGITEGFKDININISGTNIAATVRISPDPVPPPIPDT
jgi:hypothetical protein